MAAIKSDHTTASLDAPTRALLDYAVKLTKTPAAVTEGDVAALRAAGFGDRAILDAVEIVGYFNYINRIADGLDVDLEPGMRPRCGH